MQLSPLQSRLAASLGASLLLFAIYLLLFSPHFALAAELDDNNAGPVLDGEAATLRPGSVYDSDFATDDGRSFVGEVPAEVVPLMNNIPVRLSLEPGTSARLVFSSGAVPFPGGHQDLRRNEASSDAHVSRTVFVSANTCRHPEGEGIEAPQLQMTVSQEVSGATADIFEEGAATRKVDATGNVYVTVVAPEAPAPLIGAYTLELVASTDGWYHSYSSDGDINESELQWVDSDSKGALLRTRSLGLDESPSDWEAAHDAFKDDPPYALFLEKHGSNDLSGIRRSYCGLQTYAKISAVGHGKLSDTIKVTTTTSGHMPGPKQQFHIQGLSPGSSYSAILVHTGRRSLAKREEGQVGGGGRVLETRQISTKSGMVQSTS
jgi:calcium channel MID1